MKGKDTNMERREFIQAAAAGVVASTLIPQVSFGKENKKIELSYINSFRYEHQPRKLKFDPSSLKGLSPKLITSHWENNYSGSVKALNEIKKRLFEMSSSKDLPAYVYNDLKREHLMRTGSVVNHELYFDNLGGNGKVSGSIQKAIQTSFGSHDSWETEFRKIASGLAGGSGWVVLGLNQHLKILENYWCYDHMHSPAMTTPLLVMDMYEHSYHIDFGGQAAKYIDAFFANINWDEVNGRLETIRT
jgi:Fe-Mn family superoxide dismutase